MYTVCTALLWVNDSNKQSAINCFAISSQSNEWSISTVGCSMAEFILSAGVCVVIGAYSEQHSFIIMMVRVCTTKPICQPHSIHFLSSILNKRKKPDACSKTHRWRNENENELTDGSGRFLLFVVFCWEIFHLKECDLANGRHQFYLQFTSVECFTFYD